MSANVQKILKHRVVLLSGVEDYLVRRSLQEIILAAGFEKDDYDLESFSGESNPPLDWVTSASTAPFLAERRGVVVRNVLKAKVEDLPVDFFKRVPESALLILVADEESGEERNSKATSRKKALEKAVAKADGIVVNFASDPKKAHETIRQEAISAGKKMSGDAIEALVEMTGGSVSRALEEFEKIVLFSRSETISDHDVRSVVVPSREWNIWRMLDALTQGNVREALKQLKTVFSSNKKPEEFAFTTFFPQLSRQLRLLLQARICLDAGVSSDRIPASLAHHFPSKHHFPSEKEFVRNSMMRTARPLKFEQIAEALKLLSDADAAMKGMGTSFSYMDTIERLVLDLSVTLGAKKA
jgi:DNA polymerase III subunit delta